MNALTSHPRKLSDYEKKLLERLLSNDFAGRDPVAAQIEDALVRQLDAHGCLDFEVSAGPPAFTRFRVPVEGEFEDEDGITIHVLLHIVNHRVKTLEIYKEDLSEVRRMPDPSELRLFNPE